MMQIVDSDVVRSEPPSVLDSLRQARQHGGVGDVENASLTLIPIPASSRAEPHALRQSVAISTKVAMPADQVDADARAESLQLADIFPGFRLRHRARIDFHDLSRLEIGNWELSLDCRIEPRESDSFVRQVARAQRWLRPEAGLLDLTCIHNGMADQAEHRYKRR